MTIRQAGIWTLIGTEQQNELAYTALKVRCDFPWETLAPGLQAKTGRTALPCDWADLSRYAEAPKARAHKTGPTVIEEGGDKATLIEHRHRVLGLAWYSGRITIEQTLVNEPELAGEVILSEGAHAWDFFGMTDDDRIAVWNAVHPPHQQLPPGTKITDGVDLDHGHGWFDVSDYYSFVGEALMGLFVRAFSNYPVTITFRHPVTTDSARKVRELVYPPTPEPEPEPVALYGGVEGRKVYHRLDCFMRRIAGGWDYEWPIAPEGRRGCRICKP